MEDLPEYIENSMQLSPGALVSRPTWHSTTTSVGYRNVTRNPKALRIALCHIVRRSRNQVFVASGIRFEISVEVVQRVNKLNEWGTRAYASLQKGNCQIDDFD